MTMNRGNSLIGDGEALAALPLLRELDGEARLRLAPYILQRTCHAGEMILLEGEP